MLQLKIIDIEFSVCKVEDYSGINLNQEYVFTGSTDEEKSLVCPVSLVPDNTTEREDGWRAFRIEGVLDFSLSSGFLLRFQLVLLKVESAFLPYQPSIRTIY